jgi:2-dehydropantoate 2-reductase
VSDRRVVIGGAGAIGMALGAFLARSGVRVVLITRPAHVTAIRERGLRVTGAGGDVREAVEAVSHPRELAWAGGDVLFLTCKTQQTPALLSALAGIPPETPVFCLQNAVRNESWAAEAFPRVYGGVVNFSARVAGPGEVVRTRSDEVALGRVPRGVDAVVEEVAALLRTAGFRVWVDPDVMAWKWGKLLLNLSNAWMALTDVWVERAYRDPLHRVAMEAIMREGLGVLRARGIQPRMGTEGDMETFLQGLAQAGKGHPALKGEGDGARTYPSTWQDLRAGRRETEVPYFNGEIVELGRELGVPTPWNATLLRLVDEAVSRGQGPGGWSPEAIRREVVGG